MSHVETPTVIRRRWSEFNIWLLFEYLLLWARYGLIASYLLLLLPIYRIVLDMFLMAMEKSPEGALTHHVLEALELLDATMVVNFIWFIAAGSYYIFVHPYPDPTKLSKPRSLAHISSGILKEKMAGSLVGVSSVALIRIFLDIVNSPDPVNWGRILAIIAIHITLIIGYRQFNIANAAAHNQHPEVKPTSHVVEDH
jgi:uncharacterized protein (TIGR00645 family)